MRCISPKNYSSNTQQEQLYGGGHMSENYLSGMSALGGCQSIANAQYNISVISERMRPIS